MKLRNKVKLSFVFFLGIFLRSQIASADSNYTNDYNSVLLLSIIGSIFVGVLVFSLMFYFVHKFRENKNVNRNHIENENKFEAGWIIFAVILVIILIFASTGPLLNVQKPSNDLTTNAIELKVEAFQFYWTIKDKDNIYINRTDNPEAFRYRSYSHILSLNVGQNYMINATSNNVIHSFFVNELNFKIDVVPGQYNIFYFNIKDPGDYRVVCAEFCGSQHYNMVFTIRAA